MLLVILFWVAVFLVIMRLLTWIAKRHPKARDAAALVVEVGAAFAIGESVADVAAVAAGVEPSAPLVVNALFVALVGATAHYFASNVARSPLVVGLPFVLFGVAVVVGVFNPPWRTFVGLGLVALGGILGWAKYREGRKALSPKVSDEAVQA